MLKKQGINTMAKDFQDKAGRAIGSMQFNALEESWESDK